MEVQCDRYGAGSLILLLRKRETDATENRSTLPTRRHVGTLSLGHRVTLGNFRLTAYGHHTPMLSGDPRILPYGHLRINSLATFRKFATAKAAGLVLMLRYTIHYSFTFQYVVLYFRIIIIFL